MSSKSVKSSVLNYIDKYYDQMDKAIMEKVGNDDEAAINLAPGFQEVIGILGSKSETADERVTKAFDKLPGVVIEHNRAMYTLLYTMAHLINVKGEFRMYCPGPPNANYPVRLLIEYTSRLKDQQNKTASNDSADGSGTSGIESNLIGERINRLLRAIDILTFADLHDTEFRELESRVGSS